MALKYLLISINDKELTELRSSIPERQRSATIRDLLKKAGYISKGKAEEKAV